MLDEKTCVDNIEILNSGHIHIRIATTIFKDSVELAQSYRRYVLSPGDDLNKEEEKVKLLAKIIWTPAVIAAHKAAQKTTAALEAKLLETK